MPGRRSSAGQRRVRERRLSSPQDQWRKASATEILEADGLMIDGVNGFIDPDKAVGKLKNHGRGLGVMQALVAFIMSIVAVITDARYGRTYWYTNTLGGGKLGDMQYVWAFFNIVCAICGLGVYMLWNEAVAGVHRDMKVFRQKIYIWISYFTWAFGVWTTAVVFVSFKTYSFSGNYPTDLTCAFIGATLCCVLSDMWALSKLCSLGTYAARLEEEWRLLPHGSTAPPEPDLAQDLEESARQIMWTQKKNAEQRRGREKEAEATSTIQRTSSLARRRASGNGSVVQAPGEHEEGGHSEDDPASHIFAHVVALIYFLLGTVISEEDVLMPHAFERLWSALETQGEFETKIRDAVAQTTVVRHLSELGFQVVAAGTVDSLTRVLFCAKEATQNGTGAWFLAELVQNESTLTLEATFKSKSPSVVPRFVKFLTLRNIFTMDDPRC
ncbi:unnamed protein product [Ascophyllum nodosum]